MRKTVLISILLLVVTSVASAIELGRLNVLSSPGQNYKAEIALTHFGEKIIKDELLVVKGDSSGLGYKIKSVVGGSKVVFESDRPLNKEIEIDLFLSDGVEILEKRIVLTDSGEAVVSKTNAYANVSPIGFVEPTYRKYKVRRGDSLSKIASSIDVPGMTNYEKQNWIFKNNIDSFRGRNKNKLMPGRVLNLPVQIKKPPKKKIKAPVIDYKEKTEPDNGVRELKTLKIKVSELSKKVDLINQKNNDLLKKLDELTAMVKQGFAELKKEQTQ